MKRNGIVLAGTVILDIVHMVDHWPEQESVAFIERTEYGAGGPPQNAAAALKKLKAPFPVSLQGVIGDDAMLIFSWARARPMACHRRIFSAGPRPSPATPR